MIKVLYTDDEPSLLEIGKGFLEGSGEMQVEIAVSAKDAIRMLKNRVFDAIVSDYQMPGMDGIEFLKYLRGKCCTLPFILFTGRGREEIVIAAINNGADFYLQKGGDPVAQFAELGHKIKLAVQRYRSDQMIVHFNRLYAVLSGVNTTIVRATSRDELFKEICRISVEDGRFSRAWVGLVDTSKTMLVPAAHYGFEDGYLKSVQLSEDIHSHVQGSAVRAVRENSHVICNAITCEPGMEPCPGEIKKQVCYSNGAFPLYIHNTIVGAIQLYSAEENFFSESETHLLDEVASDISFALERIEAEENRVRTEISLKESEEKLAAIVAGSPVPKFVIDSDHRIIYWNKALEQATGISGAQVVGTCDQWRPFYDHERPTMADLILYGDPDRIHELYAGKVSESPVVTGAFEATDFFPHMGDKGTYLRFMAAPIKNNLGVTLGAVETLIDVSDIKRAELELVTKNEELQAACEEITATKEELRANLDELTWQERALRETEERYRNIVEDQTEFICRFRPDGTHVFVNDAYCRYFGLDREVILGHRFNPVLYADDRNAVAAFFATLTPEKPVGTIDHRIIMPDGTVRWQRWSDRAIFDERGKVTEYQSVGRDITGQKEAEEAIKRSENQLTAIIQSSPIPKFVIDKDHRVIHWNKALEGYSGIKEKEIVGTNQHWRAFYKEERPCMADLLLDGSIEKIPQWYAGKYAQSKLIEGAYEATDFFPHMSKTGTWLFFTASVIKDDEGNILGAVETLEDSTETHLKTEELNVAYLKIQEAFDQAKQSEKRYRNIVEDHTEFICRFQPDGTHVFVNDAYCRYFGVAREDILGHRFRPVLYAGDRQAVVNFFATLTPEMPVGTIDHRIIMPDGTTRWQRWSDRAIFGENGRVIEYQSVGRDITEQKQLEERLQQTSLEYQDLLENMSDVYYRSDTEGRLVLASRSWAVLLGYPGLAECIGRDIAATFSADPKECSLFLEAVYRDGYVTDFEVNLKKKDGSFVTVATSSYLYFDDAGHVLGVEGTFRDITERKRITEELKETQQRLTDIINFLPDATFAINTEGNVIAWNLAIEKMTGVFAKDILGKGDFACSLPFYGGQRPTLIDLIISGTPELMKNYSSVRRDGDTLTAETSIPHPGKKDLILWSRARPLYNSRGDITGAIESIRDITERRITEDALKQADKNLCLLSSVTRHDLLDTITVCLGYLKTAQQKSHYPEVEKCIDLLELNLGSIRARIDFMRIYQDPGVTAPVWLGIGDLVQRCPEAKKIPVMSDVSDFEVYADPLVSTVFYHLYDNTLRHGEHATGIHVSAQKRGNDLVVVWEDDGTGILPDEKEKIFEPGFGKNTGPFLCLVREILGITGISISGNGKPGSGSRLEIVIPPGSYRPVPAGMPGPVDTVTKEYYHSGGGEHAR